MISSNGIADLKRHEGFKAKLYIDTTGHRTVGYGFNVDATISEGLADAILRYQTQEKEDELTQRFDWYPNLSVARKDVIVNICFNLGVDGFAKFVNTIYLIAHGRHEEAAVEMLKSTWAKQVGGRANYLSDKFKRG